MTLPEIPDSWFKAGQMIGLFVLLLMGKVAYSDLKSGQADTHNSVAVVHEKQAENSAKIDAAKTAADAAKETAVTAVAKTDAKLDALQRTMTSLPPEVANEVKKGAGK